MSTRVKISLFLLLTSKILPRELIKNVFEEVIQNSRFVIKDDIMILNGKRMGKIKISNRITLNIREDLLNQNRFNLEKLRENLSIASEIKHRIITEENRVILEKNSQDKVVYEKLKRKIDKEEKSMQQALLRQKKDSREALKEELIDAAIDNGYEVEEKINSKNEIQLQFVRRAY
jgi:hypothetical protein